MHYRPLVLGAGLLATALGGAGCSSAAAPAADVGGTHGAGDTGGRTPEAMVTLKADGKVVCVIPLKGHSVSCKVNTAQFAAGTVHFSASYGGAGGSKPDVSPTGSMKLLRATTKTALTLSASTVKHGDEQAEKLAVEVAPEYAGTPAGQVTVRAGGTLVCKITLSSGAGSCTLTSGERPAGSYRLVASYPGSTNFTGSTSASHTLAVTK
jgi:hypothetical protein